MHLTVAPDAGEVVRLAADQAADTLRRALAAQSTARLVAATGTTQIELLRILVGAPGIDWARVQLFQLDEYIGLGSMHPASFRRFVEERLVAPAGIRHVRLIDGLAVPVDEARDLGRALTAAPVDLLLCGIGENGHLAFNDPPADFDTTTPYLVVALDEACRRQQVGEGWFPTLDDVPKTAISMSIRQMLAARTIVCVAHGARKAAAVGRCFSGPISPEAPASILKTHRETTVYLDRAAARELSPETMASFRAGASGHPTR